LSAGQCADFVVLDETHPDLVWRDSSRLLSGLLFCSHGRSPVRDVFVGGRMAVSERYHSGAEEVEEGYRRAVRELVRTADPS
jgi:formimidoylglutamate deiminase